MLLHGFLLVLSPSPLPYPTHSFFYFQQTQGVRTQGCGATHLSCHVAVPAVGGQAVYYAPNCTLLPADETQTDIDGLCTMSCTVSWQKATQDRWKL